MTATVFKNARLVLPGEVVQGTLRAEAGRIASVDAGATSALQAFDLEGDYLLPGLVEVHTDNFERHLMPRPKVQWAEMPALLAHDAEISAAGITTVLDALGVGEADVDSLRGSAWNRVLDTIDTCTERNLLRADHQLHVRCELPAPNLAQWRQAIGVAAAHCGPGACVIKLILSRGVDHGPAPTAWAM